MAYELHIERDKDLPIALSEWREAIEVTDGVRMFAAASHTITNPTTGEVISIGACDGDAEVLFPDGEWRSVFCWRGESAVFGAGFNTTETSHPVWQAAVTLASRLGAEIRGDGGERYDFQTGKVVDD